METMTKDMIRISDDKGPCEKCHTRKVQGVPTMNAVDKGIGEGSRRR